MKILTYRLSTNGLSNIYKSFSQAQSSSAVFDRLTPTKSMILAKKINVCFFFPFMIEYFLGKVAEWLNAPILKIGVAERSSRVRIPTFPI